MTKKKTLHELGEEYDAAAQQLKRMIADRRERLRAYPDCSCSSELYELKRELRVLYSQQREAKEISEYLKQYYEPHNGRRELFEYK